METVADFIFLGSKITVKVTADMKLKDACSLEVKLRQTCVDIHSVVSDFLQPCGL